jgi:hypothetical protein
MRAGGLASGQCLIDRPLEDLLRQRFTNFRTIYLPTVARLAGYGFDLLPTGQRPHFTVRLHHGDDRELDQLHAALGSFTQPTVRWRSLT